MENDFSLSELREIADAIGASLIQNYYGARTITVTFHDGKLLRFVRMLDAIATFKELEEQP